MKNILNEVADTITEEPVTITVPIVGRNRFHSFFQRVSIAPKEKVLVIRPLNFGTMIKISKLILTLDIGVFKTGSMLDGVYKVIDKSGYTVARIIAMAVVNRRKDPDDSMVHFILDNFTSKEMLTSLSIVLKQMDVTSFMSSIISIRGINLLEMSQKVSGEIIAPGEPSAE